MYTVSTVAPITIAGTPTPTLGERLVLGGFKSLTDATQVDLFSVTFATTDQLAVAGFVQFVFIAKQTTGSNQIQTYQRCVPIVAQNNGTANSGAASWGSETMGTAVTSTGGFSSIAYKINGSATMPQASASTFTFQIQIDSDLTTFAEFSCYYSIILSGQAQVALL